MNDIYSRSYGEGGALSLPDSYNGTAFDRGAENQEELHTEGEKSTQTVGASAEPMSLFGQMLKSIPFFNLGSGGFHLGTEEVLIAAVALMLFFSKGGDKECALLLFALLFIN